MADVISFRPRPSTSPASPAEPIDRRAILEQAAQAALDTADRLIALLDEMDGDPDREDGGDTEPSLGAPEGHASQIVWLRGGDRDLELNPQQDPAR